ncbi:MAG: TRAP transporter substrate-binding protein DctP [Actinomycetes bacterium]
MKKVMSLAVAAAMSLALAGCNMGAAAPGSATRDQPITIKVGDNWGATHPMAKAIDEVFKAEVEQGTDGAVVVEVYHSGTLGNEADLWDGVRNGTIELAVVGTPMNQEFPTMLISDWPFLYRDIEHAKKVWTGDIAGEVNQQFHEKFPTVEVLGWGPNSARTFTSNKPLTSVEDFAGQKFRMPNNPIHIGIAENLGASAQVIPLGELFSALETGVVDGQDNGMVTVISEGLNEVQKYVYETNHIVATLEIVASDSMMQRLSEDQQKVLRDAAAKASEKAWDDYIASVDKDRQTLRDQGLTVTELTDADRERMIEKIKPTTDKLYADNAWATELTDKIRAVN